MSPENTIREPVLTCQRVRTKNPFELTAILSEMGWP